MQIQKYKRAIAESNVLAATWLPVLGGMVGGTRCHKSPSWAVTISREVYYDDDFDVDDEHYVDVDVYVDVEVDVDIDVAVDVDVAVDDDDEKVQPGGFGSI